MTIDTMIEVLKTISYSPEFSIPVLIVVMIWVTAFIVFHNKKDALIQRITHKGNVRLSLVMTFIFLFLVLIAVDSVHFHITIWWWVTVIIWLISIFVVYRDMKPMLIVTGCNKTIYHNRRLRYYAEEIQKGKFDS